MITIMEGDWHSPAFVQVDKSAYYEDLRRPILGGRGSDPTTENLSQDLAHIGANTIKQIVKAAMRSELQQADGFIRTIWVWGMGYVLREKYSDSRVVVAVGTGGPEMTSDQSQFEAVRQEMLDYEELADHKGDGPLRATARRSVVEYFSIRSFRRIAGQGNSPVVQDESNALYTMTIGGGWAGAVYELATIVFPDLAEVEYAPPRTLEHVTAMANAIASLPRDQREGTTNALIPIYEGSTSKLADDLATLCDYVDTVKGGELSMVGHFVAANNNHARYIMLAVFLAAARIGRVSFKEAGVLETWKMKSLEFYKKSEVPEGCVTWPDDERERGIAEMIDALWPKIEAAGNDGSDEGFKDAQRALHRVVDEKLQSICWRMQDPVVLWAPMAALFYTLCKVDGMAGLLMQGDSFKSLKVQSDGFEKEWLDKIYASGPPTDYVSMPPLEW